MLPDFAKAGGLVPVVAQDALTGEVLMLAYMDEEAWGATRETGFMHYHSRSRGKLWKKGEESGHVQEVVALELDCDGDAVLAKVRQTGPACHTGEGSCFHNRAHGEGDVLLAELVRTLDERKANPDPASHTNKLLSNENLRLKKIVEEAGEVLMAAKEHDREALAGELADLLYHALVAGYAEGVKPRDVAEVLAKRRKGPRRSA
jgi:phosphoribosyl-ATP pyrophosphohydrolase/phosphoribosyl-AMP cyclohydrolase